METRVLEALSRESLTRQGRLSDAIQALHTLLRHGNPISRNMFYQVLQVCISRRNISVGRELHHLIMKSNLKQDAFLCSHLIRMFGVCGSLSDANYTFLQHPQPTVYIWNAIISAHTKLGRHLQALELYLQMHHHSVIPDGHLFVTVLHACAGVQNLTYGECIHAHVLEVGVESNVFLGSA
eukprot:c7854_g1_i1 orf=2-541(-)